MTYDILAEDWLEALRRVTVAKTWDDASVEDVVDDLVDAVPDVTKHPDQTAGPTIPRFRSNYRNADEVVRALGDVTERLFFVDDDARLRLHELDEIDAPERLEDGVDTIAVGLIEYDADRSEYANRVRAIGDLLPGEERVDEFVGDGSTRSFDLAFEPFDTPVIRVNGVDQGASASDTEAPWNAAPYEIEITQRTGQTALNGPRFYVIDNSFRRLWELTDPTSPGDATNKGSFPSGLANPHGGTFHNGILFITDNSGDELWRLDNLEDPSTAAEVGGFPAGLTQPLSLASHDGFLYFTDASGDELWELTDPTSPGDATNKGSFPNGLTGPRGMTSHNGNLYVVDFDGRELWEITDVDNPGGATNKGALPSGASLVQGLVSANGNLYVIDTADNGELWEITDVDNPGGATEMGDFPVALGQAQGIAYGNPDRVTATYRPFEPVIAIAENATEIAARGAYEKSLHIGRATQVEAQETADVYLRRYGTIVRHIAFRTLTLGFRTGQLLTVALTTPAVSGTFVIDHVRYYDFNEKVLIGEVRASDVEGDEDWTELWRSDPAGEYVESTPVYDADGNKL